MMLFWASIFTGVAQIPDTLFLKLTNTKKITQKIELVTESTKDFNPWGDPFRGHWAGVDIGFNSLTGPGFTNRPPELLSHNILRSNSLAINLLQKSINLQRIRNTFGMVTGLGVEFNGYHLDKNTTLSVWPSGKIEASNLIVNNQLKSRLVATYAKIPLLLEFQIPVNHYQNRIFISAGIYGAYRLGSHTKIKYSTDRSLEKLKTRGDFSLGDLQAGYMLRIGYRQFQFFAERSHMPLFREKAMAPDLYPFTLGLTLLRF